MKIVDFIFELLQLHDCVIVPGLGGFLAQNRSASIESNGTITPPSRVLSFNARLNGNDGLLIHAVATHSQLSFAEAKKQVENFVQTALLLLHQNEAVHFENVGSLNFDSEGNLQFTQHQNQDLFDHFFGLTEISVLPVDKVKQETISENPVKQNTKVVSFKKARRRKRVNSILKYAAAAIVILLLTISGVVGLLNSDNQPSEHIASLAPMIDSSKEQADLKAEANAEIIAAEKVEKQNNIINSTEGSPSVENSNVQSTANNFKHGYYVIVGAFSKPANAEAMYIQLQNEIGSETLVAKFPRNGLTAVGFFTSENEAEAERILARAKQKEASVWLLKI